MYKPKENPKIDERYYQDYFWKDDFLASIRKPGSKGMNTLDPATDIDDQEMANTRNTVISNGVAEPRMGSTLLIGKPAGETAQPLTTLEIRASDGTNFIIVIYGTSFYLYDPGNGTTTPQFIKINGAVTPVQTNLPYGQANWNNGYGDDRMYFCNGRDHMFKWRQGLDYLKNTTAGADATITLNDSTRFPASGTVIVQAVGGSPVALPFSANDKATGILTLTGTVGSIIPAGAAVAMGVDDVSSTFIGKIMFTWQRRLVLLNRYGVETGVYYSDVGAPEGFAAGGVDGGGAFQFSDGDGPITAGLDFGDYALIGKPNGWSQFDFIINDALNAKLVRLTPMISGQSAGTIIHQGCVKVLNKLMYPTPTEGMLQINPTQTGQNSSIDLKILSQKINNLWTQTFSIVQARSKYFDQKILTAVGVPTVRYNQTPQNQIVNNSLIAVYDILRDGYTIWDNLPVTDFVIFNSLLYYLNNSDGGLYQLFPLGIYDDNGNPYGVTIYDRERYFDSPELPKTVDKGYIEGFIDRNTLLFVDAMFNHGGVLAMQTYVIDGSNPDYVQFAQQFPLGSDLPLEFAALGTGGLGQVDALGSFRVYLDLASRYGFHTLQLRFRTLQAGARYQITGIGFNPKTQYQPPIERVLNPST